MKIRNSGSALGTTITKLKKDAKTVSNEMVIKFAETFVKNLKEGANASLSSRLSRDYRQGIRRKVTDTGVEVWLEGEEAKNIENGKAPYDMKPAFLSSPKAKVSKGGGKYLIVPIEKKIRGKAKLENIQVGKTLTDNKKRTRVKINRAGKSFPSYKHKTGLLNRALVNSKKKTVASVTSFRTVSTKSDALSWIHKGYKKHNLFKKAMLKTKSQFSQITVGS